MATGSSHAEAGSGIGRQGLGGLEALSKQDYGFKKVIGVADAFLGVRVVACSNQVPRPLAITLTGDSFFLVDSFYKGAGALFICGMAFSALAAKACL